MPYNQSMLIQAIRELDTFTQALLARGDQTLRSYDTGRFLDQVDRSMSQAERAEERRLRARRTIFTQWCSEEEIDQCLAALRSVANG